VIEGITHDDFRALWAVVEELLQHPPLNAQATSRSGGNTSVSVGEIKMDHWEWHVGLYRLELAAWPEAHEDTVADVVDKMSAQAAKFHRAGGSWYKLFNLMDVEDNGRIGFAEFFDVIRRPLPCLAIPHSQISDQDLRALWKSLDNDQSSQVSKSEFMSFMRRFDAKRGLSHGPRAAVGSVVQKAALGRQFDMQAKAGENLSTAQAKIIRDALKDLTQENVEAALRSKSRKTWEGFVSEFDWHKLAREGLAVSEDQVDDDGLHAAWRTFDPAGEGSIPVKTLLNMGQQQKDTHIGN
jgi:Ca2+-binding EF-hand superfamily protein